ncbi:SAF domain protein (plasmid) [Streptomyces sp. YIM 121038]|uniref:SAF domain-containing protein n=1 Tax=Streptomyces sp. YIM 121038 TaxID=2136401 RepID=UPI001110EAF1|nr:SAF domain-containing protein [Streptomyces sp. YIM 121038]QCX82272.1 SAF domain protein [Streptomyces sp. YIM 121038]
MKNLARNKSPVPAPPGPEVMRPDIGIVDPQPPRRRRRSFMILGAVMVLAGALGFAGLMHASAERSDVLALARDVPAGQKLTSGDLRVVALSDAPGLKPVPAQQKNQVLGRRAAAALSQGSLLTDGQLTEHGGLRPGEALVAVEVKRSMAPVDALRPGDAVQLVTRPQDGQTPDKQRGLVEVAGRVVKVGTPSSSGDVVIQAAVPDGDSAAVASDASAGRVAIVLKSKG